MRYNWWPQNMPNKELIEIWKARKMTPEDYQQWGLDPNKFGTQRLQKRTLKGTASRTLSL
jgi:hypothetical protein